MASGGDGGFAGAGGPGGELEASAGSFPDPVFAQFGRCLLGGAGQQGQRGGGHAAIGEMAG